MEIRAFNKMEIRPTPCMKRIRDYYRTVRITWAEALYLILKIQACICYMHPKTCTQPSSAWLAHRLGCCRVDQSASQRIFATLLLPCFSQRKRSFELKYLWPETFARGNWKLKQEKQLSECTSLLSLTGLGRKCHPGRLKVTVNGTDWPAKDIPE